MFRGDAAGLLNQQGGFVREHLCLQARRRLRILKAGKEFRSLARMEVRLQIVRTQPREFLPQTGRLSIKLGQFRLFLAARINCAQTPHRFQGRSPRIDVAAENPLCARDDLQEKKRLKGKPGKGKGKGHVRKRHASYLPRFMSL